MKAKYIPNILSVLRLLMAFGFAAVMIWGFPDYLYVAAILYILAGVTDVADGMLARKHGWITNAGKILDPLADKLMQIFALVCLVFRGFLPLWLLFVVIAKEVIMGVGSLIYYRRTKRIGVSRNFGKAYTVLLFSVVVLFLSIRIIFNIEVPDWAQIIAAAMLIISAVSALVLYYINDMRDVLRKKQSDQ